MQAVKLSSEFDIPPHQAYQAIVGKLPAPDTLKRMEQHIDKWSLRHPAALKSASKTIRAFAAGQAVGGTLNPETGEMENQIRPKDSTVLAAAQRIVDQVDPIIRKSESISITVDCDPVDLSLFMCRR